MTGYTHRNDNTVRGNELVGNIRVSATEYVTGRTEVQVYDLVPSTAKQASQLGF